MPKPKPQPTALQPLAPSQAFKLANPDYKPKRNAKGQLMPGWSGNPGGDAGRARRELNAMTIAGLTEAFRKGGKQAIDKVMKQSPAMFLKMLVLLVPRELQVEHSGSIKAMTDQQIEDAIAAIRRVMDAKTIDVTPTAESVSADSR